MTGEVVWPVAAHPLGLLDVDWLPRKPARQAHDGRAPVARVGHAHTVAGTKHVRYGHLVVPELDPDTPSYCTKGWRFYTNGVRYERDEAGKPVLNGWPWADLCLLAHAVWN